MVKKITLNDVREEAFDSIQKLKEGTLDVKTATEIRNMLSVVIDTAKTEVEFLKAIPNSIKEKMSFGNTNILIDTFKDKEAELENTLKELAEKRKTYVFDKKTE